MDKDFNVGLLENGLHSFNKGLEELSIYEASGKADNFQLKVSIMFLHHGIELLLKEVLRRNHGEYLIYSDIRPETVKKIIQAKQESISVFDLSKPVKTATYIDSIQRVKAFVDNPILEYSLEKNLIRLNSIRNNLEHFGVNTSKGEIEDLMFNIKEPITLFFESADIQFGEITRSSYDDLINTILLESSRLRGGGQIEPPKYEDGVLKLRYVNSYQDYQKLQPQSTVSEELYNSYWNTGSAVIKALISGGVRMLRKLEGINQVKISKQHQGYLYSISVTRQEVESFVDQAFDQIDKDWNGTFSDRYVYSKEGRDLFFSRFGDKKKI